MQQEETSRLFEDPLTDEAVIAILANDLPHMTEAQLAELLTGFFLSGPGPVADALVPLARAELSRRRFIAHVESIAAAA
jgi:hypothetical protein